MMSHPILPKGTHMRLRALPLIVSALVIGALVGCTPTSPPTDVGPSAEPATNEERIEQFADVLCPAVAADTAFNAVWEDQSATLEEIVSSAETARDEGTLAIEGVEGLVSSWPGDYQADLELVRDLYVGKTGDYAEIAEAPDLAFFTTFEFGNVTAGNDAVQRIADALGATQISCE